MSAVLVDHNHINALINAAIQWQAWICVDGEWGYATAKDANKIGQILWDANNLSVNERYNEKDSAPEYKFRLDLTVRTPINIIGAVESLDYNSCEIGRVEWKNSVAYDYCQAIKDAAIRRLPGHDGSWSIK